MINETCLRYLKNEIAEWRTLESISFTMRTKKMARARINELSNRLNYLLDMKAKQKGKKCEI